MYLFDSMKIRAISGTTKKQVPPPVMTKCVCVLVCSLNIEKNHKYLVIVSLYDQSKTAFSLIRNVCPQIWMDRWEFSVEVQFCDAKNVNDFFEGYYQSIW